MFKKCLTYTQQLTSSHSQHVVNVLYLNEWNSNMNAMAYFTNTGGESPYLIMLLDSIIGSKNFRSLELSLPG